jgi:hypothetical protein
MERKGSKNTEYRSVFNVQGCSTLDACKRFFFFFIMDFKIGESTIVEGEPTTASARSS